MNSKQIDLIQQTIEHLEQGAQEQERHATYVGNMDAYTDAARARNRAAQLREQSKAVDTLLKAYLEIGDVDEHLEAPTLGRFGDY